MPSGCFHDISKELKKREKKEPPIYKKAYLPFLMDSSKVINDSIGILPSHKKNESFFSTHLLKPVNSEPQLNIKNHQYWITWLLVGYFAAFVWIYAKKGKKLTQLFSAFLSNRAVSQLVREEYVVGNRLSIILSALFVIITSLFIYQVDQYFNWLKLGDGPPALLFLKATAVVFIFYLIKIILIYAAGFILNVQQAVLEHIFNIFLFNEIMGLLIFPLVVLLQFSSKALGLYLINIALFLMVSAYIYKFIRIMASGRQNNSISGFYLFLYLCTLEILPLVVVIKLFMSKN